MEVTEKGVGVVFFGPAGKSEVAFRRASGLPVDSPGHSPNYPMT